MAKSFYPQGEEPVDFLAVHPLKADLDRLALAPEFPRIEEFLDTNERERVVALGGLHILATERHEARRIDNQLRGRAGRQGDPGSSRFYLSLEDDLMRIFGYERIMARYEEKERQVGPELMLFHERMIMLQIVDTQWKDHLYALDHLKEGIGLRGYGQRDPLVEYKKESFAMFQALMDRIDEEILRWVFLYQAMAPPDAAGEAVPNDRPGRGPQPPPAAARAAQPRRLKGPEMALAGGRPMPRHPTFTNPVELLLGSRSALR